MGNKALLKPTIPAVDADSTIGFRYQPGAALTYSIIPKDKNKPGIFVGIRASELERPIVFFEDTTNDIEALYPTSPVSDTWASLLAVFVMAHPDLDDSDTVDSPLAEGFLKYTHTCLNNLYRTPTGKMIIDYLNQKGKTYILPSHMGNQVSGASNNDAFPPLALKLISSDSFFTEADGLINLTHRLFRKSTPTHSLQELANRMNSTPLYSLFKAAPYKYPNGFIPKYLDLITDHKRILRHDLENWFTKGEDSGFAKRLNLSQKTKAEGVSISEFIRVATIIHLSRALPAGQGVDLVSINFNTKYHREYFSQDRPPAIGLGHELIHAYWAIKGEQLGRDFDHFSTLLFELKCVGLAPWRNAVITENALRKDWNKLSQNGFDKYHKKKVVPRMQYEQLSPNTEAELINARNTFHTF
ncbi:MAG: M91 family zinc metallopeptidase [Saprospiraceae bacterium]